MPELNEVDLAALRAEEQKLKQTYQDYKDAGLKLDMTRGKPCTEQLDLAGDLLTSVGPGNARTAAGVDVRNYGGVDGLAECKTLFAEFLEVQPDEIVIGGNSSLQLMHQFVTAALLTGVPGGGASWKDQGSVKFLCPSPGYDRHFSVCEHLGIEMITVGMGPDGPDMDEVERLVAADAAIKGMWIVPKHGNPTGVTLSDETVRRLAAMKCAAPDFRLLWDNAYTVHHLVPNPPQLLNVLEACKAAGNGNRVVLFGSTSKISFAGAGVAMMGGSKANMDAMRKHLSMMTIGPDKLNQLRHVRFFKDMNGIRAHMEKHASIIRPKFELVQKVLSAELGLARVGSWNKPAGGYFVSFDTVPGCARRVVELAKEAGVKLTAAGATFPYGKDPKDQNIRLAPTLPSLPEVEQAMKVFATCVKLATLERSAS